MQIDSVETYARPRHLQLVSFLLTISADYKTPEEEAEQGAMQDI